MNEPTIRPERLFANRHRALVKRLGLGELALLQVQELVVLLAVLRRVGGVVPEHTFF